MIVLAYLHYVVTTLSETGSGLNLKQPVMLQDCETLFEAVLDQDKMQKEVCRYIFALINYEPYFQRIWNDAI